MLGILVFPRATAELVRRHATPGATVVAVDAGAEAVHAAGIVPDLVVGDMDSVTSATLAALRSAGARVETHPPEKRDTDAALGLRHLEGHDEILFLGAGGGRPDHALANLHLLVAASARAAARWVDEDARMWVAAPGRALRLALRPGATVSVLPLDPVCEGVALGSMRYELTDATMRTGDPYGISNVAGPAPQRVSVRAGRLLVIEPLERA